MVCCGGFSVRRSVGGVVALPRVVGVVVVGGGERQESTPLLHTSHGWLLLQGEVGYHRWGDGRRMPGTHPWLGGDTTNSPTRQLRLVPGLCRRDPLPREA